MRRRRTKRILRNGLLYLTFITAIVIYILASLQIAVMNPFGTLALVLSGGYILMFLWANEVE